ncbi:hypothetical protein GGR54DRAFT_611166 [Hypoxylon sp. NC1633]|nr:hypothetical protein GGR54DRAFT_611166 [Hypoxylon sp. NC1633]
MDVNSVQTIRQAGRELGDEVLSGSGPDYAAAVSWCYQNVHHAANLQNEKFRHNFYDCVVSRLENDLKVVEELVSH